MMIRVGPKNQSPAEAGLGVPLTADGPYMKKGSL
jgi:hypothetical protein